MDVASRRATANRGRSPAPRTRRRSAQNSGAEGEQRRLVQLAVSLALFLLVYIGRGVFPAQLEMWKTAAAANVDFKAVFQQFCSAVSQGKPLQGALETLCVELLGGEVREEEPPQDSSFAQPKAVVLLSQTPGGGLTYWNEHGLALIHI